MNSVKNVKNVKKNNKINKSEENIPNMKFMYMYCDNADTVQHNEVVFGNISQRTWVDIERRLHDALHEYNYFLADMIGVPSCFFYDDLDKPEEYVPHPVLDHPYHTFLSVKVTNEPVNDPQKRDIVDFCLEVNRHSTAFKNAKLDWLYYSLELYNSHKAGGTKRATEA